MIGTVVVPLDGSELAERALKYAIAIAQRCDAQILLVRVTRIGADDPEMVDARNYLRKVGGSLPIPFQFQVERGRPAETVVRIARETTNPTIVMSTHGRGGIHRWMTGSVADKVVRSAGVPVLLVRGDVELPETALQLHTILVPVDGSKYSETALAYAVELARAFGSTLHVLRVVDTPSAYAMLSRHMETAATGNILEEILGSMRQEASEYLEKLAEVLKQDGIEVKTVMFEGYPGEQLIDYERQGYFQLVVMATAGRSGVSRVVFGSVAERVLKLGRSPVMMIRPVEPTQEKPAH
jgi:nucleotide-binding universal stress UspA family protein